MKKLILLLVCLAIIIPVGYYLLSPLFIVVEKQEVSPLLQETQPTEAAIVPPSREPEESLEIPRPSGQEPKAPTKNSQATLVVKADFTERAHEVEGQALLIDTPNGKVLRFENFYTVNGPNLHIYLASSLDNKDFVDLGKIKATSGDVNYDLTADIDLEKYNKVLVWCVPFGVLFSYADLS